MLAALLAIVTSTALVIGPTPTDEPVPVQRPAAIAPAPAHAPAPAPTPAPAPMPEPEPAPVPESTPPLPESEPPAQTETLGRIEGVVTDMQSAGAPIAGASVQLLCPCLPEPEQTATAVDGSFAIEGLPPGTYTVLVDRGGRPTKQTVTLAIGGMQRVHLRIAPPTSTAELDRRKVEAQRARTMLAGGSVAAAAGLFMLIGAAVETNKPECKFDLDDCPAAPRKGVARGLGIGGAVLVIAGGALIGVGAYRLRKLRAYVELEDRAVALVVGGRF